VLYGFVTREEVICDSNLTATRVIRKHIDSKMTARYPKPTSTARGYLNFLKILSSKKVQCKREQNGLDIDFCTVENGISFQHQREAEEPYMAVY